MTVFSILPLKAIKTLHASVVCKLMCAISLVVLPYFTGYATENMDTARISVDFNQIRLSQALDYLYDHYKFNIAFSKPDEARDLIISYKATDKSIEQVLNELMNNTGFSFTKIGGQYVIYREEEMPPKAEQTPQLGNIVKDSITIRDTIVAYQTQYKTDTLIRTDTIVRVDTIVHYDTVTIFKERPAETKARLRSIRKDVFDQDARRKQGYALHVYAGSLLSMIDNTPKDESYEALASLWDKAENTSFRSKTAGFNVVLNQPDFCISAGLSYTDINHRFQYSRITLTGGDYLIDTLDTYYAVSGPDTTWYYVKDSTFQPLSERRFDYTDMNHLGFLELQLGAGYTFLHMPGVRLYARGGVGLGVLIQYNGTAISEEEEYNAVPAKDLDIQQFHFSLNAGFGGRFRISDAFDFVPEVQYVYYPQAVFTDYAVTRNVSAISFKFGLMYYF